MKALLIDDEMAALMENQRFLHTKGLACDIAKDAREAVNLLLNEHYCCIVMNVVLEKNSNYELVKSLHRFSDSPIILFTDSEEDELIHNTLYNKTMDYILKSWTKERKWSKIKNCIADHLNNPARLICRSLTIDQIERTVHVNGKKVVLTPLQFDILVYLFKEKGNVLSMEMIYREVWKMEDLNQLETVQVNISRLRRKLQEAEPRFDFIGTVRGKGYTFLFD